jgi:hypothetical protein
MNFFSSDVFLSTLAEVFHPGRDREIATFSAQDQLFRLLSIDGGPPITSWEFMDSVAPFEGPPEGPVRKLRYLPRVVLETEAVTALPENVVSGPEYYPAPFIRWAEFGGWEDFERHFAGRRKNLIRDSRSKRKRLEKDLGPVTVRFDDRRPEVFESCVAWKSCQCHRTGVPDQFGRPENAQFFRCLSTRGVLPISSIEAGGRLLAVHFGALEDGRFYSWVAAYDPELGRYSPGRLLLEDMLRECQQRGLSEFDFGIGHHEYKWYYATHNRTIGPLGHAPIAQVLGQGFAVNARRLLGRHPALLATAKRLRQAYRDLRARGEASRPGAAAHSRIETVTTTEGERRAMPETARVTTPANDDGASAPGKKRRRLPVVEGPGVGCQLAAFPGELASGPPSLQEPWLHYFRRRAKGFGLRIRHELGRLRRPAPAAPAPGPATPIVAPDLEVGDRVRVRSLEDIRSTLDERGYLKGCGFAYGQQQFCGRAFRVVKRVNHFFDEARARMLRGHNLVLLDGVYCEGENCEWTRGCDRMCFYFWRSEWLEKVEGPKHA